MSEESENPKKIYLQSIKFDVFMQIVEKINLIDSLYMYSMPTHIKAYEGDVNKLTSPIFSFYENEDEKWRVNLTRGVEAQVTKDSFSFQDKRIVDCRVCLCMPITNSIILVPGDESIKLGWDCSKIVQFTNLVSLTPRLLRLLDMVNEDDPEKHHIGIDYEIVETSSENPDSIESIAESVEK